jgi:hypothetical protein
VGNVYKTNNNPAYLFILENKSAGVRFIADMPEQYQIGVNATYEEISSGSGRVGGGSGVVKGLWGGFQIQPLTKKVWTGTQHISWQVTCLLDAENNAKQDVHDAAVLLQSMCLPQGFEANIAGINDLSSSGSALAGNTNILLPPNPPLWDSDHNRTAIQIGKMFYFHSVHLTNVNYSVESRFARDGFPIAGQIDIQGETDYILTRQQFQLAGGGSDPRRLSP